MIKGGGTKAKAEKTSEEGARTGSGLVKKSKNGIWLRRLRGGGSLDLRWTLEEIDQERIKESPEVIGGRKKW